MLGARRAARALGIAALLVVAEAVSARAQGVDLSPRAAARGAIPSVELGDAGASSAPPEGNGASRSTVERPPLFPGRRREEVPLERRSDGSYRYQGVGFDAVIERDGSAVMRDKFGKARFVLSPVQFANGLWGFTFLKARYDLFGLLDRVFHNDPFRSERRRFLIATRELRDQLATEAYARSAGALERALEMIWSAGGLSFAERRRRTVALWEEQAEDEVGRLGRALIVRFIRQRCPAESACAFSDQELRDINAKRESAPFHPYAL